MSITLADQYIRDLEKKSRELDNRIAGALGVIHKFANTDGAHHKQWLIDQVVQSLTGPQYDQWVSDFEGNDDYWDKGIAP